MAAVFLFFYFLKMVQCPKLYLGRCSLLRYNSSGFYEEKLSLIGLGSKSFPLDENGNPDIEKCSGIFSAAFEKGITFFFIPPDSGDDIEKLVGENLIGKLRYDYSISGGISITSFPEDSDVEKIFSEQLARLKNGYFDYYEIRIGKGTFDFFVKRNIHGIFSGFKARGKIKHLGFSFEGSDAEWEKVINDYSWDYARLELNFYSWDFLGADRYYRDLRKKGIPFIASDPYMGGMILNPPQEVLDILKEGCPISSMREWALRWYFDKKGLLCIITDPSDADEISSDADIISDTKSLNSSKRHYLKIASQTLFEKNAEAKPIDTDENASAI